MANTNRSKLLDSFFYDSQTWSALHKAWKGYVIAKNKHEYDRMEYYASVIQKLQIQLGLRVSLFPDIGMSALKFYSSKCTNERCLNKEDDNGKEMITEESLCEGDDGEYFNEDFNNRDRFTS